MPWQLTMCTVYRRQTGYIHLFHFIVLDRFSITQIPQFDSKNRMICSLLNGMLFSILNRQKLIQLPIQSRSIWLVEFWFVRMNVLQMRKWLDFAINDVHNKCIMHRSIIFAFICNDTRFHSCAHFSSGSHQLCIWNFGIGCNNTPRNNELIASNILTMIAIWIADKLLWARVQDYVIC